MVDPNPMGIIDTPISYVARSNLMQIAQILQVLAMWKLEEADPKLSDLYSQFNQDSVSSILDDLLESAKDLADTAELYEEELRRNNDAIPCDAENGRVEEPLLSANCQGGLSRVAVLLTRHQLEQLIGFFRTLQNSQNISEVALSSDLDTAELAKLLTPLPESIPGDFDAKKLFLFSGLF